MSFAWRAVFEVAISTSVNSYSDAFGFACVCWSFSAFGRLSPNSCAVFHHFLLASYEILRSHTVDVRYRVVPGGGGGVDVCFRAPWLECLLCRTKSMMLSLSIFICTFTRCKNT